LYKVEPHSRTLARRLFSKDDDRLSLLDKVEPGWPKVPLVSKPKPFACLAERLARAASCPDGTGIGPASKPEGVAPDPDAGEEVALLESGEVASSNIDN